MSEKQTTSFKEASAAGRWLDHSVLAWVFVCAAFVPHSIAAAQIAWGVGLSTWALRRLLPGAPPLVRSPLDYPLLAFFALTITSSFFSYDPEVSVGKLRAASLFTIVYFVAQNVRSRRAASALAFLLIISCGVNVLYTVGERILGRGVKLQGIAAESVLRAAGIEDGDTLLRLDGRALHNLAELEQGLQGAPHDSPARVRIYRFEGTPVIDIPRGRVLAGNTPEERLGVRGWARGRDWRAAGFYGHYTTYAEVLQLIAALACGLLLASVTAARRASLRARTLLAGAVIGLCAALALTVTRASALSFLVAVVVMAALSRNRQITLALSLSLVLLIPAGLFLLQSQRNVGFFDRKDPSINYREIVWREGARLLVADPRHLIVGVGMDSLKRHWREWKMFDEGRLPIGHLHSTYLQIALERGIPALLAWLGLIYLDARMLFDALRRRGIELRWDERGVLLGALGGLAGFATSGLVHYNLGDSEVAMVFYFIMGLTLVYRQDRQDFRD